MEAIVVSRLEHLAALGKGADYWNRWRADHPKLNPDFSKEVLGRVNLRGYDLRGVDFEEADLSDSVLGLHDFDESFAWPERNCPYPRRLSFLTQMQIARYGEHPADLRGANLFLADLRGANLGWVRMDDAFAQRALFKGATLAHATFIDADLRQACFGSRDTDLRYVDMTGANLHEADLRNVDARNAVLRDAQLRCADFRGANLSEADLRFCHLVGTRFDDCVLTGAQIYGVSAWDISVSLGTVQKNLAVSRHSDVASIEVDDIRIAQFVWPLIENPNIRMVIETMGSKAVLLLGRFSPERKVVLDALRAELRNRGYVPIVFDFEKATNLDITETVQILAGLSLFVIADITNPKSSPLELQATIPDFMTPFVPIIQRGEQPFAMFNDLVIQYDWVLAPLRYDSVETLCSAFTRAILEPALSMQKRLVERRNRLVSMRDAKDYIQEGLQDDREG
jgi:uncharacterized protein YjbI with pentapeptide repeats